MKFKKLKGFGYLAQHKNMISKSIKTWNEQTYRRARSLVSGIERRANNDVVSMEETVLWGRMLEWTSCLKRPGPAIS